MWRRRYKGGGRFAAERQAGVGLEVDLRAKEAESAFAAPFSSHTRVLAALLNPLLNASLEVRRSRGCPTPQQQSTLDVALLGSLGGARAPWELNATH